MSWRERKKSISIHPSIHTFFPSYPLLCNQKISCFFFPNDAVILVSVLRDRQIQHQFFFFKLQNSFLQSFNHFFFSCLLSLFVSLFLFPISALFPTLQPFLPCEIDEATGLGQSRANLKQKKKRSQKFSSRRSILTKFEAKLEVFCCER